MKNFCLALAAVCVLCFTNIADAQCTSCKGGACQVLAAPAKVVHSVLAKVTNRCEGCGEKSACEPACEPKCEPRCKVRCRRACEKPCEPKCEAPAEPKCEPACDPCAEVCRRTPIRNLIARIKARRCGQVNCCE